MADRSWDARGRFTLPIARRVSNTPTGMRRGELAALRWEDIDLSAGTVTVSRNRVVGGHGVVEGSTKSSRARRIALDAPTVAALRDWRARQADERGSLPRRLGWRRPGVDVRGRLPPFIRIISRTHLRLVEQAGVRRLSPHKARHTSATLAWESGVHVSKVSKRLGHASVRDHDGHVRRADRRG